MGEYRHLRPTARLGDVAGESRNPAGHPGTSTQRGWTRPTTFILRTSHSTTVDYHSMRNRSYPAVAKPTQEPLLQAVPTPRPIGEVETTYQNPSGYLPFLRFRCSPTLILNVCRYNGSGVEPDLRLLRPSEDRPPPQSPRNNRVGLREIRRQRFLGRDHRRTLAFGGATHVEDPGSS